MQKILGLLILISACKNAPKLDQTNETSSGLQLVRSPAMQFPTIPYDSVVLFSVDSKFYNSDDIVLLDEKIMTAQYTDGTAIIDSLGKPSSKFYTSNSLSESDQEELKKAFYLPRNEGGIIRMTCMPIYRDVFVFYQNKKQIAQAQICLECKQAYLTPDTSNLSDRLTTDGDWNKIKSLIEKVNAG